MEADRSGYRSLERGAVAFENYLASVLHNESYVRRNYLGYGKIWSNNIGMGYFNSE